MFKVGQKIEALETSQNNHITKGKVYVVLAYAIPEYVYVVGDDGYRRYVFTSRFKGHEVKPIADKEAIVLPATTLPVDSNARKEYPLFRGVLRYFPAALAGVAKTSKMGNDKHNPGEEMHHARSKSADQADCIMRHLVDVEDLLAAMKRGDTSVTPAVVLNEVNQMAWRALAFSQELHEQFGAPIAPGAKK